MTEEEREYLIQEAMGLLSGGARPVERAKVEKAFGDVQRTKRDKKDRYTPDLRYALTVEHRDAAKKAAKLLKSALAVFEPVSALVSGLSFDKHLIEKQLKSLQQNLQTIAETKIRPPSRFDARMLFTAQRAVLLLEAAGKPWSSTRHLDADKLAATLWGDTDPDSHTDFQQYLLRVLGLRRERRRLRRLRRLHPRPSQRVAANQPGTD
jgi:hypothetical protein